MSPNQNISAGFFVFLLLHERVHAISDLGYCRRIDGNNYAVARDTNRTVTFKSCWVIVDVSARIIIRQCQWQSSSSSRFILWPLSCFPFIAFTCYTLFNRDGWIIESARACRRWRGRHTPSRTSFGCGNALAFSMDRQLVLFSLLFFGYKQNFI